MAKIRFSELCRFTEKQRVATATADSHRYTLFGGSRGPGKSHWIRWYIVRFLMLAARNGFPNMRAMLACEDYPSLYERQISKVQIEFPLWLGTFHTSRNEFRLDKQWGSGVVAFRNLDDASKYMSAEYGLIAIDELTKNPERTFHVLRGSLRWPGFDGVRFIAASNPAPNWVREYFVEHRLPEELQGTEGDFAFVPALPADNPNLPESYWAMLNTLPGALRQSWLLGDWYSAIEGLVYETFSAENIVETEPDPERPIELAVDDGYSPDPRATLFFQRQPNGDLLVFDELYQYKTLEEVTVRNVVERCEEQKWPKPELAVVSHEAPALRERFRLADIPARNWLAAKSALAGERSKRGAAIRMTRGYFCDGQGHRTIKIHRRCTNLLDEIGAGYKYPPGKHGHDVLPEDGNDHACLVPGTMITTDRGLIAIEHIKPGDMVLTRQGYKPVMAAALTKLKANVLEVEFSDGRTLRATPNHLIWTRCKDYSACKSLGLYDIILTDKEVLYQGDITQWRSAHQERTGCTSQKPSNSTGLFSDATRSLNDGQTRCTSVPMQCTSRTGLRRYTERFGSPSTDQFQRGITFITRMVIPSIMTYPISTAYQVKTIHLSMTGQPGQTNTKKNLSSILQKHDRTERITNGSELTQAGQRCVRMLLNNGRANHLPPKFARCAARNIRRHFRPDRSIVRRHVQPRSEIQQFIWKSESAHNAVSHSRLPSILGKSDAPVSVMRITPVAEPSPVYDLTVGDAHEYFANGVLVHNCNALETYVFMRLGVNA